MNAMTRPRHVWSRITVLVVAVFCVITGLAVQAGQGRGQPQQAPAPQGGAAAPRIDGRGAPAPRPRNLQVLPTELTNQEVNLVMISFTQALGVSCAHCHMYVGQGSPMNDMASDAKPQKNVARAMMRMAADINTTLASAVSKPDDARTRVQCMTCHRGSAIPQSPQPAAAAGAGRGEAPAPARN